MKKEFIKDNTLSFITHILIYMKAIFLIPIIIKTVGVSVYGSFSLITAFVGIIVGLSSMGVGVKSFRYLPSSKTAVQKAQNFYPPFYFKLFMLFLISTLIVIFGSNIKSFFVEKDSNFSIYILPIYLLLYIVYEYSNSYLRYSSKIFYMCLHGIGYAYLHVSFILIYSNFDDISINVLFLSQAFMAFLISMPVIYIIYKEINFRFIYFKLSEIKEQIKIGFPMVLNFIADFILAASDRFVLAYFMGAIAVGLYVPAYTLGALILLVPKAIGTVVPQLMAKSIDSGEFEQAKKLFINSIQIFVLVCIPFIFGSYLIGYEALLLLANEEVAIKGKYIATIVALSSLFYGFNLLMSQANMIDLKTGVIFKANFIAALFNFISNVVLLYFFENIYIPAITTVLSFMIATIYFYKSLDEKWIDKLLFIFVLKIILVSTMMFFMVFMVSIYLPQNTIIINMFIKIILVVLVYVILLIIFKIYTKEQLKSIKGMFKK
jgi:O-antigen/teichoic acid export membrane protein